MGQRLNLEIWNNGKVLANAYYHWSAYTESAAAVVDLALEGTKVFSQGGNDLLYAIRLLEATGAGLTTSEREHIQEQAEFKGCEFKECEGRNAGLIAVSEQGIAETRAWEEGTARIYLDEKRVSFNVFWTERWYEWEKERREDYGEEEADYKKLQVVDFNFEDIKYDDWGVVCAFLKRIEEPFRTKINTHDVVVPIC